MVWSASDACVVVPAFNEETVIGDVVTDLRSAFEQIICVDDGSADRTSDQAAAAGATVLRHPINLGQGAALATGFRYAVMKTRSQFVVTFDADGQHATQDASKMVAQAMDHDLDVVLGTRRQSLADVPPLRRAVLRAALWQTRTTTGLALTDTHNGLRVLRRSAVSAIRLTQPGMAHASELLSEIARLGLPWAEADVVIRYSEYSRAKGQPHINAVNILYDLAVAKLRAS